MKETFYHEEHYEDWPGLVGIICSVIHILYLVVFFIGSCVNAVIKIVQKVFKR